MSELSKGKDSIIQDYAGRILVLQDIIQQKIDKNKLLITDLSNKDEQLQKLKELLERCKSAIQHTTKDRSLLDELNELLKQSK